MTDGLDFKISKNFWAHEVLPPEAGEKRVGEMILAITPFLRLVPQRFRDLIGRPANMNNWRSGGRLRYRGWRPIDCAIGASLSRHKYGMAVDISINGMSSQEILDFFIKNKDKFPEITRYERVLNTPTWNHFDASYTGLSTLQEVRPR